MYNKFKIFDSHSRDLHGMPSSFGRCVFLSIEGLENLVLFFQKSSPQQRCIPFEIRGVAFSPGCSDHDENLQEFVNNQYLKGMCPQKRKSMKSGEQKVIDSETYLKKNMMPPCAVKNGLTFPEKPDFLADLNELEWRLVAQRLAFQKLMEACGGKQHKITGNFVNVPADVTNIVSTLPRLLYETQTIKVQLKRRLQCKSSALSLNIRPHKLYQAAL